MSSWGFVPDYFLGSLSLSLSLSPLPLSLSVLDSTCVHIHLPPVRFIPFYTRRIFLRRGGRPTYGLGTGKRSGFSKRYWICTSAKIQSELEKRKD